MKKVPLQLNADPRLARAIYSLAERDGVSVAALLRESAERYIAERESEMDPLDGLIGLWKDDGPSFDATELDEELALDHEERYS